MASFRCKACGGAVLYEAELGFFHEDPRARDRHLLEPTAWVWVPKSPLDSRESNGRSQVGDVGQQAAPRAREDLHRAGGARVRVEPHESVN